MAGYDLHVHSSYSDGAHSLETLSILAGAADLDGFAVTDHDTVEGLEKVSILAEKTGLDILPGLEISTQWQGREVHILAYRFDWRHPVLLEGLAFLAAARRRRIETMVEKITAAGYGITVEEVLTMAKHGTVGRPHIAAVLTAKGFFPDTAAVFSALLLPGQPGYVPRVKFSPMEAIELVLAAGGIPVLAHPGLDKAYRFLPELMKAGLLGLEVYHSSHNPRQQEHFLQMVKTAGLLYTAGSDFHGESVKAGIPLGCCRLPRSELVRQGLLSG